MMEQELIILNSMGLHARPAALIARCAADFKAEITINKSGEIVNAKSILGIMMLSAGMGTKLVVSAIGDDAEDALSALMELFESKFGEE